MSEQTPSTADIAGELSSWMAAGGILTMMLFPFALPLILLLVASALPLVLVAAAGALLAAPVLLVRALWRRAIARRGRDDEPGALNRSRPRGSPASGPPAAGGRPRPPGGANQRSAPHTGGRAPA